MTHGDRLAADVRAAMVPLQDAKENSPAALRVRQMKAYTQLWESLERYEKAAAGRQEKR